MVGKGNMAMPHRKPRFMVMLQEMFESSLMEVLSDEDSPDGQGDLKARLASAIPDVADSIAESMLATIKRDAPVGLKEKREYQQQFEERLRNHWQRSLELLDLLVSLATEGGDEFNETFKEEAGRSNDPVFKALTLLHARACQIASAILVLLRSGYADDAHARWRTLHEIAVVSNFIGEKGKDVAVKYLLHDNVQRYKLAIKHRMHAEAINDEPISEEEFDELKAEQDRLVVEFGESFKEDHGWAASALGKDRPRFADIEESVDLEHLRPYYGMASDNTHAKRPRSLLQVGLELRAKRSAPSRSKQYGAS